MSATDSRLRILLPIGSLEEPVLKLFDLADLHVSRVGDSYYGSIDDPRIKEVIFLRPQHIPILISSGNFDLGVLGYDWLIEEGWGGVIEDPTEWMEVFRQGYIDPPCIPPDVFVKLARMPFGRQTLTRPRIVMAVGNSDEIQSPKDIPPGSTVVTEYMKITRRFCYRERGQCPTLHFSYGSTEVLVPLLGRALVDLTETGSRLKAHDMRIIAEILETDTVLLTSQMSYFGRPMEPSSDLWRALDPLGFNSWEHLYRGTLSKREALDDITMLLLGAFEAQGKVMLKMNVSEDKLAAVLALLPSLKSPTVSSLADLGYYAVESVVSKDGINVLIPELQRAGATGIIEMPISKITS